MEKYNQVCINTESDGSGMTDHDLFKQNLPVFMEDYNEPFQMAGIGCTLFKDSRKSPSSRFYIEFSENTGTVLEYALFWHYDIQHLYDLEHVFLYLDHSGSVIDIVSSFHGKFYRQSDPEFKDGRPVLYIQPGKHAIMAHPEYFRLFVDFHECCNKKAGTDGVLIPDFLCDRLSKTENDDRLTEQYIKDKFSFAPSENYRPAKIPELITDWPGLKDYIVSSVNKELSVIRGGSY